MYLDLFNIEIYQYDMRLVRYSSFAWGILYSLVYLGTLVAALEWLWVKNEFDETDEQAIPDMLVGMGLVYAVI